MNPTAHRPPFKFATVPHGSTETTMMNNYPKMHRYMSPYNKSEVKYGVKAVKDGSVHRCNGSMILHMTLANAFKFTLII